MDFLVMVKRDDVMFPCKSEEQLNLFLSEGYEVVEEPKEKKPRRKADK